MGRDAPEIVHEIDYWKGVVEDVGTLNNLVTGAAVELASAPIHLLTLTIGATSDAALDSAVAAGACVRSAMSALGQMQEPLDRIIALAEGREIVIAREVHGEPQEDAA